MTPPHGGLNEHTPADTLNTEHAAQPLTSPEQLTPDRLARVEQLLGHTFTDRAILALALVHASASDARLGSNERLEFLGDAILGAIVCELIFERYPTSLEGDMTKLKSTVVSRKTCANVAKRLGLEHHIVVGKGMLTHRRLPASLSAAVVESLVAAVYLDAGYAAATAVVRPLFEQPVADAAASGHQHNYKSVLQQHAQQQLGCSPHYKVISEDGPDHAKRFEVAVDLDGHTHAPCWAASKKQAEQLAAREALYAMGVIEDATADD